MNLNNGRCLVAQFHQPSGNYKNSISSSDPASKNPQQLPGNPMVSLLVPIAPRFLKIQIPQTWLMVETYRKYEGIFNQEFPIFSKEYLWHSFLLEYRNQA